LKSALVSDGDLVTHSMQHADHYQLGFDRAVVDDIGAMKRCPQARCELVARSASFGKEKRAVEAALERSEKTRCRRLG
jgi:hypothetical protein